MVPRFQSPLEQLCSDLIRNILLNMMELVTLKIAVMDHLVLHFSCMSSSPSILPVLISPSNDCSSLCLLALTIMPMVVMLLMRLPTLHLKLSQPTSIDDAYADWYFWKTGQKIDCLQVLPVLHALQGHPESGRL